MANETIGTSSTALEVGLLLLLEEAPSHGYELLARVPSLGLPVPESTRLYRTLRRLTDEGLTVAEWDTASIRGPARRVYAITPQGREQLRERLADLAEEARVVQKLQTRVRRLDRRTVRR